MHPWIDCTVTLPPENKIVATKLGNNESFLKRSGGLWFIPERNMYVYYTPSHWRELTAEETREVGKQMLKEAKALRDRAEEIEHSLP